MQEIRSVATNQTSMISINPPTPSNLPMQCAGAMVSLVMFSPRHRLNLTAKETNNALARLDKRIFARLRGRYLLVNAVNVEAPACIKINLGQVLPPRSTVVDTSAKVEDNDNENGDVVGKEVLGTGRAAQRRDSEVELDDDEDDAPGQTPPRGVRVRP